MKKLLLILAFFTLQAQSQDLDKMLERQLIDTVGFAQYQWQMDSIMKRMDAQDKIPVIDTYKAVICPHDDYSYAAGLYNKTLSGIHAKTIILIGVAHSAKNFNLENKVVFGNYSSWKTAGGSVKVSELRNELLLKLKEDTYVVHDSMIQTEHSLEAIIPFLKQKNKNVEIIPMLVPYAEFDFMEKASAEISSALHDLMIEKKLRFGPDVAIVISNDAIHYGNEDWGGSDLAPFGVDELGNGKARQKDSIIISQTLSGETTNRKIKEFNNLTVKKDNFKEYRWTWCGRYSVPFGLMVANNLNLLTVNKPLCGELIDYRNSLQDKHIKVKDLGMGTTAPAKSTHWVGYVGMGYQ